MGDHIWKVWLIRFFKKKKNERKKCFTPLLFSLCFEVQLQPGFKASFSWKVTGKKILIVLVNTYGLARNLCNSGLWKHQWSGSRNKGPANPGKKKLMCCNRHYSSHLIRLSGCIPQTLRLRRRDKLTRAFLNNFSELKEKDHPCSMCWWFVWLM